MIYGYARVSTKEQNEDRQLIAFRESGYDFDRIFIEKQSGKDFNRTEYRKMIKAVKKGDIIVIKSIDRLGRNYNEIIEQWRRITKVKNADIIVLDMPILDTTKNKDLLGTLISNLVLQLLSYVAENERVNIKQRQTEGIAAAKAKGVKFGRSPVYDYRDYIDVYDRFRRQEITQKQAMEIIGCCKTTYYRLIKDIKKAKRLEEA
ncbi:MAG: recombinase family protein [Lachnospiraceae bacterium]|nr:recombinase family protein [Lachnospiraceae bacterium]